MSAITVNNISKRFRLPHHKKTTLLQNAIGLIKRQMTYEEFWALKDISFEVDKGEALGIVGRNGSGKSTLLKMLARVLYPDTGSVRVNGKVASFLELGVGFQTELTAAENVYIYASVLGMNRRATQRIYEDIFDFAELKKFEDMKLKNFSSGMYARLAFSTAIFINPDIMLIDEVLAVGDESFQSKCIDTINRFKQEGKTIIFVSHDLITIEKLCDKALLLDLGRTIMQGNTKKVIDEYHRALLYKDSKLDTGSLNRGEAGRNFDSIIGMTADASANGNTPGSYVVFNRFTAFATGEASVYKVKSAAPGNVKVAIYSDNTGIPDRLLCSTGITIVNAGWNDIIITDTALNEGTNYWLAIAWGDGAAIYYRGPNTDIQRHSPVTFATYDFPNPFNGDYILDTYGYFLTVGKA